MDASKGTLIEPLSLYSEQCSVLLRQALEREEKEGKLPSQKPLPATDSSDSDEEEQIQSASSSSSEEEETEEPPQSSSASSSKPENNVTAKSNHKKKKVKPTQTQQQQQHAVKKYVDNLVCDTLPINDTEALHLPTSLLSKPQDSAIAERNYVARSPCQEYLALTESLQKSSNNINNNKNVLVILLRSGRFAAGIFQQDKCLVHRACVRYTVRKGQGKAQSTQDGNRRPKSMGAQLRRAGEENLQQDIRETMENWKSHISENKTVLILLSCPKAMKKYLFEALTDSIGIGKKDPRIRRLPLDIGRPSFENVCIAHQVIMTVQLRQQQQQQGGPSTMEERSSTTVTTTVKTEARATATTTTKEPEIVFPLTPLHEACQKGDLATITGMIANPQQVLSCLNEHGEETSLAVEQMMQRRVGPDFMTCLHYAAAAATAQEAVDTETAAACVTLLLLEGKANPAMIDARNRPPYFMATQDKIRDAFRMARATLGEEYCKWETVAKVGPPLTEDDVQAKKTREAEKRRKKKARQKQKKAEDKAAAAQEQQEEKQAEEAKKQQEAAKRVRDGLQPKAAAAGGNVCDFCQKVVKGRKRKDMFSRLEYVYCTAECVQKHKRELMAAAALSRFGG